MRKILAGLMLAATALGGAARAQAIDDPQANVVEALVVSAKLPGPAWWRVSDGDTTIYVMGTPSALPKGMAWDRSVLERRLDGASVLLTPPEWRAGLGDIPALLRLRGNLKDDGDWTGRSPALAARTQRAWSGVDPKNAGEWRKWKPLFVALQLNGKANSQAQLQTAQPDKTIKDVARKQRVKTRPAAVHKAMPMLKALVREHSEEAGLTCLSETLDATEAGPAPIRAAADAWAQGRVKDALAGPRSAERCELLMPGVADLKRQLVDDEVQALTDLLKTPGHAVAYFPLRALVAENGVLDKLRARGITVRTPGEG
ncbi:TraB/GumN family protein [Caulobacter sp. X]|uniref:TraB/GumN family protein n=1 Tax=Caulobacter sp. X TaxID=2048901 RepID=UPI000C1484A4|nr:TraB/GumN family protein [Caulobacter sp. X]PIC01446.1 TraB/GumN family protein [Caulobacter sp. X]